MIKTFNILDIKSPEFLKQLNIDKLQLLCDDIRKFIIENVSHTGGHFSSNLGVVEATVALHYVFNSPSDKIIFDVGHQCYTHKILTGRSKEFSKLRQFNGLNGFIKYNESIHDVWEAGHSSTSLSAAAGFLEAKEVDATIGEVIAFIGDGSIQNGLAFEGLNYIGSQKKQKAIIILNDNEMSISQNVGRMAKTLSRKRVKKSHMNLRKVTPKFLYKPTQAIRNALKIFLYGNDIFTSLGYRYYGPINGHDLKTLIKYFTYAKNSDTSIVIHLNTIKGMGYQFSEEDNFGKWHGTGPFDVKTGKLLKKVPDGYTHWGNIIAKILIKEMNIHENIRVINPAMIVGSFLNEIMTVHQNKIIDVGINEEHALVMAASMSRNGIIPIVSMYSTFFQRAYDALNHDVCRNNNHVIFLLDHAGIVSNDGDTHQGVFDIAMAISLPNIVITMPKNAYQMQELIRLSIDYNGPFIIRYPKYVIKEDFTSDEKIEFGKWIVEKQLSDINIITYGMNVDEYKEKIKDLNIGLINALFIKPVDLDLLKTLKGKKIIVVEEVMKTSSLATLIMEASFEYQLDLKIKSFGVDEYLECGTREELLKELNIDVNSVIKKIN